MLFVNKKILCKIIMSLAKEKTFLHTRDSFTRTSVIHKLLCNMCIYTLYNHGVDLLHNVSVLPCRSVILESHPCGKTMVVKFLRICHRWKYKRSHFRTIAEFCLKTYKSNGRLLQTKVRVRVHLSDITFWITQNIWKTKVSYISH